MADGSNGGEGLERLDPYRVLVRKTGAMRTDGLLFASEGMMKAILSDNAVSQIRNVACLPGIAGRSLAMPDIHWGYGFPIGGVAAFDLEEGVVSPGGVGYDINCGVRILATNLSLRDAKGREKKLVDAVFGEIPAGLGSRHKSSRIAGRDLDRVLVEGAGWAVESGRGTVSDLDRIEDRGRIEGADPAAVGPRAKERGSPQLGTLGSGNHFAEVDYVEEVYDEPCASGFGLNRGMLVVSVHSGSRGLGHQVCDDAIKTMLKASAKYGIDLPDKQLCAAPIRSPEGRTYLSAMACAANFAFANRQVLGDMFEGALRKVFGPSARATLVYDVCHNIAKIEEHEVCGSRALFCVHRKGATRAFPAGHPALSEAVRPFGQPVLIPGDMGRCSFVLAGLKGAMDETFGSCCHGAGREMSRHRAVNESRGRNLLSELAEAGVSVRAASRETIAEEMPGAYKDVNAVVDVVQGAGLAKKVARLRPICVVKG